MIKKFPGQPPRYYPKDFLPQPPANGAARPVAVDPPEAVPEPFVQNLPLAEYANPQAQHVLWDFYNWHPKAHYIAVLDNNAFPQKEYQRITHNHFQGIQRLNDGEHVVLSGGSKHSQCSNLFVVHLGSHERRTAPIGSNLLKNGQPHHTDLLKAIILLDNQRYWHAGGISVCGDILVVPLETETDSRIIFLNMRNPTDPIQYQNEIFRPTQKAGATSLMQLPNGHFLCAVWTEDGGHHFDFYLSDIPHITSTYHHHHFRVDYERIRNRSKKKPRFQGIHFIQQDSTIYLTGTGNTDKLTPITKGTDQAHLFEIKLNAQTMEAVDPVLHRVDIQQVARREFDSGKNYYDMGAAGGAFVNAAGRLSMYSGHHWRRSGYLRFAEFDPPLLGSATELVDPDKAIIELYSDKQFKGLCLKLFGIDEDHTTILDYSKVCVQRLNFENKVSSARIYLPKGYTYVLYEKRNFRGKQLRLKGTGYVQEYADFGEFNDRTTASRFIGLNR
ncbi:MAG: hypothetical protein AAGD05_00445 [Bacteroidota bacterium]